MISSYTGTEMREAVSRYGPEEVPSTKTTTGLLANDLLGVEKRHPTVLPVGLRPWLLRVKLAAEQRNAVVHAVGRDRCIGCGDSSIFEHKHRPIDRSEQRIRTLIGEIEDLIDEGIELAVELSGKLNELLLADARKRAAVTGQPQTPVQVRIAGGWHRCAVCSTEGRTETGVGAPTAVMVLPPGTDIRGLFNAQQ
ncbi:hypothetical protein ABZW96_35905 [Nocardia sp. NPDC004168]|uniref:hypothetical protein n=1 Tax=Nocardia sp. NPDC004168 TaxID=3154452 RepID=UPI0033A608B6